MQAEAAKPLQASTVGPEVVDHPPADAAHHDHRGDHAIHHRVVPVAHQVVAPEAEAGVVVSANAVKKRSPEALKRVGDVGEAEGVEHHRAKPHHTEARDQDAVEGGADAAYPEFIQGPALVKPVAQA